MCEIIDFAIRNDSGAQRNWKDWKLQWSNQGVEEAKKHVEVFNVIMGILGNLKFSGKLKLWHPENWNSLLCKNSQKSSGVVRTLADTMF